MRHRFIGGTVLALAAVATAAGPGLAQPGGGGFPPPPGAGAAPDSAFPIGGPAEYYARGQAEGGGFQVPTNSDPVLPIPTGGGPGGQAGFYGATKFLYWTQTRSLGNQRIAFRGAIDTSGRITGIPGGLVGSGATALTTGDLGRTNYFPGYMVELGYKFDDGTRFFGRYGQLFQANYNDGATLAPFAGRTGANQNDTFLTAPAFNFSPQFAGPQRKTGYDFQPLVGTPQLVQIATSNTFSPTTGNLVSSTPVFATLSVPGIPAVGDPQFNPGFNTYGIFNAAVEMTIKYSQRFTQAEVGGTTPIFQTDYSRVYATAGGKYAWFFERFEFRAADRDLDGIGLPQYAARYTNTLSQRMYGPFLGCGHEIFLANQFSLNVESTVAGLLSVEKNRAKYILGDESTQSKRGLNTFGLVPNLNASADIQWFPTEGVELKVGYQGQAYFGTKYMKNPVGFNVSAPDPSIEVKPVRILHGIWAGIGLFF